MIGLAVSGEQLVVRYPGTDEQLSAQGRDGLGTLIAAADWVTQRAQTPAGRH